jgi:hypothetical protein
MSNFRAAGDILTCSSDSKFNKHGLDYVGVSFLKFDPEKRRVYAVPLTQLARHLADNIRYVTDIEYFRETEVRNDPLAAKQSAAHWVSVVMDALRAGVEEIRGLSPMDQYIDLEDLRRFGSDSD